MVLNVENYLRRISFHDEVQIKPGTLATLHRMHLLRIPFENLDIHHGRKINLDIKRIENKIVSNRRGGFCYELNGLFGALLCQLGFDVKMISARVFGKEKIGREFDHMLLWVNFGEEWLVDVGFGDNFLEPIRIEVGTKQPDPTGSFRIERHDSSHLRLESDKDGSGYSPKYLFTLDERQLEDFAEMCEYHQTSPESSFTQEQVCTLATELGRITLRDDMFIETINGHKNFRRVKGGTEYNQLLKDRFGIEIQ